MGGGRCLKTWDASTQLFLPYLAVFDAGTDQGRAHQKTALDRASPFQDPVTISFILSCELTPKRIPLIIKQIPWIASNIIPLHQLRGGKG